MSLRFRHAFPRCNVHLEPRDARSDGCDRSIAARTFPPASFSRALIVPVRFSTSSGLPRRARRTVTFGMSGSGASATATSTQDGAVRSGDRHQSDAVAIVAAVDHAQVTTDATARASCSAGAAARDCRIGLVASASRSGALARMCGMRAAGGSGSADDRGRWSVRQLSRGARGSRGHRTTSASSARSKRLTDEANGVPLIASPTNTQASRILRNVCDARAGDARRAESRRPRL